MQVDKKMILSPFSAIISFLFPQKIDTEANKVDNSRKTEREEFEDNIKKHGAYVLYLDMIKRYKNISSYSSDIKINYFLPYKMGVVIMRPPFATDWLMRIQFIRYKEDKRCDLIELFRGTEHILYKEINKEFVQINEEEANQIKRKLFQYECVDADRDFFVSIGDSAYHDRKKL